MTGEKPLTGRKVFLMFAAGFGVIIAVNITLAVQAVRTFPGLEVKNSYIASQSFDADRAAQEALDWEVAMTREPGMLFLHVTDRTGQRAEIETVTAQIGRTTHSGEDQHLQFSRDSDGWRARIPLDPGRWQLSFVLEGSAGEIFRQRRVLLIPDRPEG